jgi:hypothetical protein
MSHVFKRYDVVHGRWNVPRALESADGEWVRAQDAYDAVAIIEAKVRVLETQLKDTKKAAKPAKKEPKQ